MVSVQGRRPRENYGPRLIIPDSYGNNPRTRQYGKAVNAERGDAALPAETGVLEPNMIAQRRQSAGYNNTMAFARDMDSISYQRLKRIENGRVIVRQSEYELIADFLDVDIDDLRLPLLTRSETVEWNAKWGPDRRIEEGGDHDSVLLAAYVRHLVEIVGRTRQQIVDAFGASGNCLSAIWYAEKPIDRYPDSTMTVVIRLAKTETWDDVILLSRSAYERHKLDEHIAEIHAPRIRYAPEDPDRKAPWTYLTDPLRPRKRRKAAQTPFSAEPAEMTQQERQRIERRENAIIRREAPRKRCREILDQVRGCNIGETLFQLFPADPAGREELERDPVQARNVIARALIVRECPSPITFTAAAEAIGRTRERVRQISKAVDGTIRPFLAFIPTDEGTSH